MDNKMQQQKKSFTKQKHKNELQVNTQKSFKIPQ